MSIARASTRTGPIGRAVRLGWLAVVVATLLSIADARGSARFRDRHILSEPTAWLVHLVALALFLILVGSLAARGTAAISRRAQTVALMLVIATVAASAYVSFVSSGSWWGRPLSDIVWYFDVGVLVEQVFAFALSIAFGTPGCEIGVWRELLLRAQGRPVTTTTGLACIVGIDAIDRWEARRRV